MGLNIIVACNILDNSIDLNWISKKDFQYFKNITSTSDNNELPTIILGRKTFETIGKSLPNRKNIVLSTKKQPPVDGIIWAKSFKKALKLSSSTIFVIGGEQIYNYVFKNFLDDIDKVYITWVSGISETGTQYFPVKTVKRNFYLENSNNETDICKKNNIEIQLQYDMFLPKNKDETKYLQLIKKIIKKGDDRLDRTGIGTKSLFGQQLKYDLKRFPLLTTKKMGYKTVLRELLWFLSGSTDSTILEQQKVYIWKGNTSREFLNSRELNHLPEGDIGAGYGHQFRHYNAEYINCRSDYTNKGIDQIQNLIDGLKKDPYSRRHLVVIWNPSQLYLMALPPCHFAFQMYIRKNKYLDCQLYQRSCDIGLGVPFNIASYALLTYMIAHILELKPGQLIHVMGDTHVYNNHIEALEKQIQRKPFKFPKLKINRKVTDIFDFKENDFELQEYKSHGIVKMDMAV